MRRRVAWAGTAPHHQITTSHASGAAAHLCEARSLRAERDVACELVPPHCGGEEVVALRVGLLHREPRVLRHGERVGRWLRLPVAPDEVVVPARALRVGGDGELSGALAVAPGLAAQLHRLRGMECMQVGC